MKVTILIENKCYRNALVCEHGLSLFIETGNEKIIFDTGASDNFIDNANKLDIDLKNADYLVLSHGHYDHTGGIAFAATSNNLKQVILHQDAYEKKYKLVDGEYVYNGVPKQLPETLLEPKLKRTENLVQIDRDLYVLGDIVHNRPNREYYREKDGKFIIDDFHDEQILIVRENKALSLFMGCSHFGVIAGIKAVKAAFPDAKIKNLVAGMHLSKESDEAILRIIEEMNDLDIEKVIPLHCTGINATVLFKQNFRGKCEIHSTGDSFKI